MKELIAFHRSRKRILAEAEPDVLALETVPDIREAEALLTALAGTGMRAWLSYTVDDQRTRAGQSIVEAFGLAEGVDDIIAVGVNCRHPGDVEAAVPLAARASGEPVVAYPNSGEGWDATARTWTGQAALSDRPLDAWVRDGARLIGGCCRVTPEHIAAISSRVSP